MKLSELVHYKNQLDQLSSIPISKSADNDLAVITQLTSTQAVQLGNLNNRLHADQQSIRASFEDFEKTLVQLKEELQQLIFTTEKPWFAESYRLYDVEMPHETADYILSRHPNLQPDTDTFYRTRITNLTNWKYPAMIIRPGNGQYIQSLVACDPLYLVDDRHELLAPVMNMYNEVYQRRLRPYVIQESLEQEILGKLPNEQFGLIFAYNFFNFKPFEVIKKYFEEIYTKLRPGGTFVFTFNDCDRYKAVMLVEQHFCVYTPGYLVKELVESIGFEIAFSWNNDGPSTWLEIKKPGELTSLRGGQTLAKIFAKSK